MKAHENGSLQKRLDTTTEEKYVDEINNNDVVVWGKSYCPYTKKARELLKTLKVNFDGPDLDKIENGPSIQAALKKKTGQSSVPNIFIQGKHFGGSSDLEQANKDGSLQKLLSAK